MKTKQNNQPTSDELKEFTSYRNAITSERLAFLNHAKQNFSESAEKMAEAQENYNNSLIFTYNDYSRLPKKIKTITLNEELMNDVFNQMSAQQIDVDIDYLKSNISKLTKAIIFLNAHTFDIDLSKNDRIELKEHMTTLSDYRSTLLSTFQGEKHQAVDPLQDEKSKYPTLMHSSVDELLLMMYEFLSQIDYWQQEIEASNNEDLSNDFSEAYNWLEEKIIFFRRRNCEVSSSERNEVRCHIKHYSKLAPENLGGCNE